MDITVPLKELAKLDNQLTIAKETLMLIGGYPEKVQTEAEAIKDRSAIIRLAYQTILKIGELDD